LRLWPLGLLVILAASACAADRVQDSIRVPLDRWLAGPEEHLPGWSVQVGPPFLTFPLRMAVEVTGKGDLDRLKGAGHTLHFFVKVAGTDGRWFPERRYSSITDLPRSGTLVVTERFYAKPGDYTVALAIYDSTTQKHGVWKRPVHIPKDDNLLQYPSAGAVEFFDPDLPFKPGNVPAPQVLENQKPLRIDVVVNLTERNELNLGGTSELIGPELSRGPRRGRPVAAEWQLGLDRQESYTDSLLAIANVVTQVGINGCLRVSALDSVRGAVLLDRRSSLDPSALFTSVREHRNTTKVDARVLATRRNAGAHLRDFLQQVIADDSGCAAADSHTERAVVLISDSLAFPDSKQLRPLDAPAANQHATRFYFFRLSVNEILRLYLSRGGYQPIPVTHNDHVAHLFEYLDVRRFDLAQPKDFQKALPKFLEELKNTPSPSP
jgi:hypothetical protein